MSHEMFMLHPHISSGEPTMNSTSMRMFFHFGYGDTLLIESFKIKSPVCMWTGCGILFVMAILLEAIKYYRRVGCKCRSNNGSSSVLGDDGDHMIHGPKPIPGLLHKERICQTVLHTMQTVLAYTLMLAFMTFNVCLCFSIISGAAMGYYIFYRPYSEASP